MKIIDRYIDELLLSSPEKPLWNQEMIRQNKKTSWNYIDGCMMTAFLQLYKQTGIEKYLLFVKNYMDYFIDDQGNILTFNEEEYNLDNINEGRALFKLYDYYKDEKYRKAIEKIYNQIRNQPRTRDGNFWHKKIYPDQVWLDGLYMALPFYMEYEKRFNKKKNYKDIISQFLQVQSLLQDKKSGLYFHGYDSSRKMFWSDEHTGLSSCFWLRAMGWFLMSLVDILEILDDEDSGFKWRILNIFRELSVSLLKFQHSSGMWFQVVNKGSDPSNYLETSGSAIICYAFLKAAHLGILPTEYRQIGENAFDGICKKYLYEKNGKMNLGGICLVAGLGGKENRNGSYEYYMSEPVVENDAKGIAPFILAYLYRRKDQNT
jgi:unsaturated rhamnogalacturonyl hydrolase